MTDKEVSIVRKLFDKCMEINQKGKAEAFFHLSPHVKQISIRIHTPNWTRDKDGKDMYSYYDSPDFYKDPELHEYSLEAIEEELDKYI
ncbi:MAG: hypothetical protein D8H95_14945 [Lachnospiraceae bacterium]|nr:MAG: hypothetical protein D8H95_14945 [Lachnospiraceae bacterium]